MRLLPRSADLPRLFAVIRQHPVTVGKYDRVTFIGLGDTNKIASRLVFCNIVAVFTGICRLVTLRVYFESGIIFSSLIVVPRVAVVFLHDATFRDVSAYHDDRFFSYLQTCEDFLEKTENCSSALCPLPVEGLERVAVWEYTR